MINSSIEKEITQVKEGFLEILTKDYPNLTRTSKIGHWHEMHWKYFQLELMNQGIFLSGNSQRNWNKLFLEEKGKIEHLKRSMSASEQE